MSCFNFRGKPKPIEVRCHHFADTIACLGDVGSHRTIYAVKALETKLLEILEIRQQFRLKSVNDLKKMSYLFMIIEVKNRSILRTCIEIVLKREAT